MRKMKSLILRSSLLFAAAGWAAGCGGKSDDGLTAKLMEANERATELLIKGLTVEGLPGWDGGRGQTIRYIDWDTPANNRFTVLRCNPVRRLISRAETPSTRSIRRTSAHCSTPTNPSSSPIATDQRGSEAGRTTPAPRRNGLIFNRRRRPSFHSAPTDDVRY